MNPIANKIPNRFVQSGLVTITITVLFIFAYHNFKYSHFLSWRKYKEYLWIINDSARKDVDTNLCFSLKNKRDVYTFFNYKQNGNIQIWDFRKLKYLELNEIHFNYGYKFGSLNFDRGEIFNLDINPQIMVRRGFRFNNSININFDNYCSIIDEIQGPNYKGIIGKINQVSISNEIGKPQILFDYSRKNELTLFLFYTQYRTNYLIVINSLDTLNTSSLKVLNLR